MESSAKALETFTDDLKLGRVKRFHKIACSTINILKAVVNGNTWKTASGLLEEIKQCGRIMARAKPTEAAIGNMVRRVLKIVRDEYVTGLKGSTNWEGEESLHSMFVAADGEKSLGDYGREMPGLAEAVLDGMGELIAELDTSKDNIVSQAPQHIQSEEVILTVGGSNTVLAFLKYAAKSRSFQVVVVDVAPFFEGQRLAHSLASADIPTTLIPDSAVFAVMSRVNKVVIGTYSVMANGGLKAACGMHAVALAAKRYSVPLIVCCGMTKLSPLYLCSYDQDAFNKFSCAEEVADFSQDIQGQVYTPVYDYVPPDLVTLFVSNIGGNAPSYVYRLLSEFYHPDDYDL